MSGQESTVKNQLDEENGLGKELNSMKMTNSTKIEPINNNTDIKIINAGQNKIGWWKYAGIIFSLLAAIMFSFSTLTSKMLSQKKYHFLNIAIWRNQGMVIFVPFFAIYLRYIKKQKIFDVLFQENGKTFFFLVIRGTLGFCALVLYVYSLKYLKLADATVISFSTPIAVTLFARICLGEPCGIIPIIMAFITLGGVIVLTRPPLLTGGEAFDNDILFGTSLAFGCMLFLTSVFVIVRYLRKVHFSLVIMFYGYVATIEGLILGAIFGVLEFPRKEDWTIAIINLIVTVVGQCFMTLSLKYEAAGPVALIRTCDIVFSFIAQLIFLGVYPDYISILGAAIIMFGIVVITLRKWLTTLPENNPSRIKYWFILK